MRRVAFKLAKPHPGNVALLPNHTIQNRQVSSIKYNECIVTLKYMKPHSAVGAELLVTLVEWSTDATANLPAESKKLSTVFRNLDVMFLNLPVA